MSQKWFGFWNTIFHENLEHADASLGQIHVFKEFFWFIMIYKNGIPVVDMDFFN